MLNFLDRLDMLFAWLERFKNWGLGISAIATAFTWLAGAFNNAPEAIIFAAVASLAALAAVFGSRSGFRITRSVTLRDAGNILWSEATDRGFGGTDLDLRTRIYRDAQRGGIAIQGRDQLDLPLRPLTISELQRGEPHWNAGYAERWYVPNQQIRLTNLWTKDGRNSIIAYDLRIKPIDLKRYIRRFKP